MSRAVRNRPIYEIQLRGESRAEGFRGLRRLLKILGRYHRLRCIIAREIRR